MRSNKHRGPLRFAVLTALLATIGATLPASGAPPASQVRFTEVMEQLVRNSIRLPGSVQSRTTSIVASEVEGLVVALNVREGESVRKDQPLARLRTINFELMLRAARGQLKEAEARLQLAESRLARARRLFDDEIVSQEDLDDAFSEFTAWQGRVDQTTAEILRLEEALARCVIRAPFHGIVTVKQTDVGQWLQRGGPVAEMVSLDELEVRVEVPEKAFDRLRSVGAARVSFEALPGLIVEGQVDGIIPRADPRARTFPVLVRIANADGRIGVGMLAEVALPVGESASAFVVPKDAVVRDGQGEVVYRIRDDQTVEPVPVRSGQGLGSWIVVAGDVTAGQRVVTRGNERLRPGQTVQGSPMEYPLP